MGTLRRNLRLISILPTLAIVFALAAAPATAEVKVVVTIKPVHALASAVMEGEGAPVLLIAGAASPHTYALKPSDAQALNRAQLVIRVSEGLESFLSRTIKGLPRGTRILTLDRAPGMTLHRLREGGPFEAHAHASKAGGHGAAHGHGSDKGSSLSVDPHVWLDPRNASAIADAIAAALAEIDPAKKAHFEANATRLKARLEALERRLDARLLPLKGRPVVVFHDAYQYFERRFGLTVAGSITVSPELAPSARRLSALRARIGALGAACVFAEPQFEPRLVATITEGTKARPGELDPLGAALPAGPQQYEALMEGLASSLERCFSAN